MIEIHCFILYINNEGMKRGYFKIKDINEQQKIIDYFKKNSPSKDTIYDSISDNKNNIFYSVEHCKNPFIFDYDELIKQNAKLPSIQNNYIGNILKCNTKIPRINNDYKKRRFEENSKMMICLKNNDERLNYQLNNSKDMINPKLNIKKSKIDRKRGMTPFNISSNRTNKDIDLPIILPQRPIYKLPAPGVIGLYSNDRIHCMNAVLQCLSNIPELKTELLKIDIYNELEKNKNKKITFALTEVIKNLWENMNQKIYNPQNFQEIITQDIPYCKNITWCEPKDLIIFVLRKMHKELNMQNSKKKVNIIKNNNFEDYFNAYKSNYDLNNNSIISELFDIFYGYTLQCYTCYNHQWYVENSKYINFSLDDIRKDNFNIEINIYEFFDNYYQGRKQLFQHCFNCGKQNIFQQLNSLFLPRILIVNFDYGKGSQNNIINIKYEESLNLERYNTYRNSYHHYDLIGAICYTKNNSGDMQYIAFCKNSKNNKWYKYIDQNVYRSTFKEISSCGQAKTLIFHSNKNKSN
jgi:ubiquitin C-terminal hydrolase